MTWNDSLLTYVWIFAVGRGNAAFLRSALNQGFILDMAGGKFIDPSDLLRQNLIFKLDEYKGDQERGRKIAQAILSHPHSDHIAQCSELEHKESDLHPVLLTCPHDKEQGTQVDERVDWSRIKNPSGSEAIVGAYRRLYKERRLPLQTIRFESRRTVPNLEYGIYYVRPPECSKLHGSDDNKYANAMSIVFYYRHGANTILFPGDVTPEALELILRDSDAVEKRYTEFRSDALDRHPSWHQQTEDQPSLGSLLGDKGLSVLVAPHHGLESGYSEELYKAIRGGSPGVVVLSERRHRSPNDGSTDPRYSSESGARGLNVSVDYGQSQVRRTISTKAGDHILIIFSGSGAPRIYMRKEITDLIAIASP